MAVVAVPPALVGGLGPGLVVGTDVVADALSLALVHALHLLAQVLGLWKVCSWDIKLHETICTCARHYCAAVVGLR